MSKDQKKKHEDRVREVESPAHKKRRSTKQTLNRIENAHNLEEVENFFDDDDVEVFERLKKRRP